MTIVGVEWDRNEGEKKLEVTGQDGRDERARICNCWPYSHECPLCKRIYKLHR